MRVSLLVARREARRWYAISRRRALRVLTRELRRELDYFDVTGNWPAG